MVVFDDRKAVALAPGPPESLDWGVQKALPGMRAHGIAKQRRVTALFDPVAPCVLPIGPSDGEIFETRDSIINNGAVAHRRANHLVATVRQGVEDLSQILPVDCELGAEHPRQILVHPSLPSADTILGDCYDQAVPEATHSRRSGCAAIDPDQRRLCAAGSDD